MDKSKNVDIRKAARLALTQLLEPLAGFALDAGLATSDVHALLREAAVRCAAAKQLESAARVNISGIAASTGIPRGEISRILKAKPESADDDSDGQQSTNRVLAAWHSNPKFTAPNGQPAELKLYGRGNSFEALARKYGLGIPTRAILDELMRAGAVEITQAQTIRAKASIAVEKGMSASGVKAFGERGAELLSTLLSNLRQPETPQLVASVSDASVSVASLPLIKKELETRAADFLGDINDGLRGNSLAKLPKRRLKDSARVSVTIFYHEAPPGAQVAERMSNSKRRYFRRRK